MKWPHCPANGVSDCVWPSDRSALSDWLARRNCITDKIYNWCKVTNEFTSYYSVSI